MLKSVIQILRELREDHDYSQREIADILGISQQHYSKYENGVSADYLIGRCTYEAKKPLEMVYVTHDCSCEKLLQDTLSLSQSGRRSVVEYIQLQRLKETQNTDIS